MNKFWMKRQQWKYPLILFLIFISVIGLSLPKGALYGSTTDWYSQHAALAETIRTACLEQKTLLPKYLDLGGGSNGFLFSYYGYLRPDIVLGCLFPQVPMQYFVMGYMLIGYFVSVLLFYRLLLAEKMPNFQAFLGSALFLLSTCFFQTHRQVMFINYMPFLIAAFLLIKKKKYCWIPLLLSLIYCNSFYYAIAVLASIGWYWYREEGIAFFKHYIKSTLLSIGMTAALLIPTGLVILEHKRSGTGPEGIFAFHWDFASLLYSPYGMGLTAICLYTLFLGLSSKRYRVDSLFYLFLTGSGLAAYVLNGFLYARSKILIPFVPLFLLHCVRIFRELQTKKLTWRFWPFLPLLGVLACYRKSELFLVLIADCLIIFFVLLVNKYFPQRNIALLILLILPACAFLKTADTEKYVSLAQVEDIGVETSFHRNTGLAQVYAKESSPISVKTSKFSLALQNDLYRFDSIYEPLSTGNRDASSNRKKSTMYSSITDESYRQVYYDLLMTPIQINNRIALLAADNPFLLYFMGVRYLETSSEHIPDGYRILKREGNRVIAENENVLPLAYLTKNAIEETDFEKLDAYAKLETLMQTTVIDSKTDVPDTAPASVATLHTPAKKDAAIAEKHKSQIQEYEPQFQTCNLPDGLVIEKLAPDSYEVTADQRYQFTLNFTQSITDQILLLSFEVESLDGNPVVIEMDQIRNKLSGKTAPYPNENHQFHYQFSTTDRAEDSGLQISLSKGKYRISRIQWHVCPKNLLQSKEITKVSTLPTSADEIFSCTAQADTDAYFITSIPRQHGMKLWVDGKKVPMLTVNKAFCGAIVPEGRHAIRITFTPPGLYWGYTISLLSVLAFLFSIRRRLAFSLARC